MLTSKIRRTLALALAVALAVMLVACGGTGSSDSDNAQNGNASSDGDGKPVASEPADTAANDGNSKNTAKKAGITETARKSISKDAEILWETDDFKVYITKVETELQIAEFGSSFQDGLLAVQNASGVWGYIDNTGSLAIPFQYAFASAFSEGLALVGFDDASGAYVNDATGAYINTKGEVVISLEWDGGGRDFSEGLAAVYMDGGWGYVDTTGKVIIPGQYRSAEPFSEGFAAVEIEGYKWGFIDKTGAVVVPLEYVSAGSFHDGAASVAVEGDQDNYDRVGFVNTKGDLIIPCNYLAQSYTLYKFFFRDGLTVLEDYDSGDKYLYAASGNPLLELGSGSVSTYWANGLIIIKTTQYGITSFACYDYEGNPIAEPSVIQKFADPTRSIQINFPESGNTAAKQLFYIHRATADWGVADLDGNMIIEQKYDSIRQFCDGLAFAALDNEYYILDEQGNVFAADWSPEMSITDFNDGLALVYPTYDRSSELYILEKQ
jgi:hypothetical protein